MLTRWIEALIAVLMAWLGVFTTGGCMPYAMPKEFAQVAAGMVQMVQDQGVLDEFMSNARAHGLNPGGEVYFTTTLASGVRLVGIDADVNLQAQGTGTQLPSGLRQSLIEQLNGPISDEQRAAILAVLGWNRVESPHDPVP